MRLSTLIATLLLILTIAGCSLLPDQIDETKGWSADKFYTEAKAALDDGDYETAIDLYGKLEGRYPYGRYAQQAQLETAYAHYKAAQPAAAIAAAERFIKLHPRHQNVDYAYYLRGLASFKQGDNFLEKMFPQDPSERDPKSARESFRYFQELVQRFPQSKYADDAIQRMTFLRNRLAKYEIHVADYYLRRKAYLAAAKRAKYVVENYARTPSVPDALDILVKAYRQMGEDKLAADAQRVLELNFPNAPAQTQATGDNH